MSNLSSQKIQKIRVRQKVKMFLRYILIFLFILTPIIYFRNKNGNNSTNDNLLGSQIEVSQPATTTKQDPKICLDTLLDNHLISEISKQYENIAMVTTTSDKTACDIQVMRKVYDSNQYIAIHKSVYALVNRVDSEIVDLNISNIREGLKSGFILGKAVIWAQEDQKAIESFVTDSLIINKGNIDQVLSELENSRNIFAIIPLSKTSPNFRIEKINSVSPLDENLYIYEYPLTDYIWINADAEDRYQQTSEDIKKIISENVTNRDFSQELISKITLTGRSAFGARQYFNISSSPIANINENLQQSDILFISNESSFTDECQQQNNSNFLCGKILHFDWIKNSGADVVSVAGESIIDQGRASFNNTLDLYRDGNIYVTGGGKNRNEALTPVKLKIGDKEIAFISVSLITPTRYLATNNLSGNVAADQNKGDAKNLIQMLNSAQNAQIKIVEIRWNSNKDGTITDLQKYYIDIAIKNGADIIIGTAEDKIGKIYHIDDSIVFNSLGDLVYIPDEKNEYHGFGIDLYLYEGKFISYKIRPIELDQSYNLSFSDMDTTIKIMNTVYVNPFIEL